MILVRGLIVALLLLAAGLSVFMNNPDGPILMMVVAFSITAGIATAITRPLGLSQGMAFFLFFIFYLGIASLWSLVPFITMTTWIIFAASGLFAIALSRSSILPVACVAGVSAMLLVVDQSPFIDLSLPGIDPREYDPNLLAAILNGALFIVAGRVLMAPPEKRILAACAVLCALFMAGILMTQSRGGMICLIAGWVLTLALNYRHPTIRHHAAIFGAGIGALGVAGFALTGPRLLQFLAPLQDEGITGRLALWKGAGSIIADYPFTGTGLGTFYLFYRAYRVPGTDKSAGFWAHHDGLQFAAETGIAGGLLFYAVMIGIACWMWRLIRAADQTPTYRLGLTALGAGMLVTCMNAQWTYLFYSPAILILFAAAIASADQFSVTLPSWSRVLAVGYGGIAAVTAWLVFSSFYFLAINDTDSAARYGSSLNANLYMIRADNRISFLANQSPDEAVLADIHANLDRARSLNPGSPRPDYLEARLYSKLKQTETARQAFERALAINPYYDVARMDYIQLLRDQKEWGSVLAVATRALSDPLPPQYAGMMLRHAWDAQQEIAKAQQAPKKKTKKKK